MADEAKQDKSNSPARNKAEQVELDTASPERVQRQGARVQHDRPLTPAESKAREEVRLEQNAQATDLHAEPSDAPGEGYEPTESAEEKQAVRDAG